MKEYLSQNGIEYTERDVARDEAALAELETLGIFSTPVTVVNGELVVGFDKSRLEQLLENKIKKQRR